MRRLALLLLPIAATAAPAPSVRTISAADAPVATASIPPCTANVPASPLIRSVSTTADAIVSPVATGQCLPARPRSATGIYPAPQPHHAAVARKHRLPEDDAGVRACVAKAAHVFQVEKTALYLILDVERGTIGQTSQPNRDGSVDIGPMQINSWWLPRLRTAGLTEKDIKDDLCLNIMTGAWIYAQERRHTKTEAAAIARYHSPTPAEQRVYLDLIQKAIDRRLVRAEEPKSPSPCATQSPACNPTSTSSAASSRTLAASTPISSGT
ncbi:MAG: lytic transglycosylase domain-containing protein [Sulfuricaulis sp.]